MMKKVTSLTSLLVAGSMLMTLFSGCGSTNQPGGSPTGSQETGGEGGSFLIAENNWGQGVAALDLIESEARYTVTSLGGEFQVYNDEFSADKMMTNIQGMLSSGADGIMYFGSVATLIPNVSQMCQQAQVPFVIFDQIPAEEAVLEQLEANPYYVGSVGTDNYAAGANMATRALESGCTKALILGGAMGDPVHDARISGFTETFEAGGGTVAGVARCDSPADGTTKCDDLIAANPDADCIYALTGDYATSALTALNNHSADMKVYASDATANTMQDLKDGKIEVADGGTSIVTTLAGTLLVNYLKGNPIQDADGKAPYLNTIVAFPITAENADDYQTYWLSGNPLTEEQLSALCQEDTTLADIDTFIAEYSLESIVAGH